MSSLGTLSYIKNLTFVSPQGQMATSPADREIVGEHGVCVIDCSWNKIEGIPFSKLKGGYNRLRKGSLI